MMTMVDGMPMAVPELEAKLSRVKLDFEVFLAFCLQLSAVCLCLSVVYILS